MAERGKGQSSRLQRQHELAGGPAGIFGALARQHDATVGVVMSKIVEAPDGRSVKIAHDAGNLNRIDRVTAGSYGMEINRTYCRNAFIELDGNTQMLQAASLYFQASPWPAQRMAEILWDTALTSLDVLFDDLEDS